MEGKYEKENTVTFQKKKKIELAFEISLQKIGIFKNNKKWHFFHIS